VIAPRAPRCSELSSNDALAERPRPCPQHDRLSEGVLLVGSALRVDT